MKRYANLKTIRELALMRTWRKNLMEAEKAVAAFSGAEIKDLEYQYDKTAVRQDTKVQVLTEDKINLGMFYLSHREIIQKLIEASDRVAKYYK